MSKLAEYRAAKVASEGVQAAKDGVVAKAVTVQVMAGSFSTGSETVNVQIKFFKANDLVASLPLAQALAKAVGKNIESMMIGAAQEAAAVLSAARSAARSEAQDVLQEVGP